MSQTPVDGSDREGRTVREDDRGAESPSLFDRVVVRFRSFGQTIADRLRSLTTGSDELGDFDRTGEETSLATRERTRSVQCVGLTEEVVEGDGRAVTEDLVRAQAAEGDDRDGPADDRPELAAEESDDELTLRAPDDPDAHITSTYWEDVER